MQTLGTLKVENRTFISESSDNSNHFKFKLNVIINVSLQIFCASVKIYPIKILIKHIRGIELSIALFHVEFYKQFFMSCRFKSGNIWSSYLIISVFDENFTRYRDTRFTRRNCTQYIQLLGNLQVQFPCKYLLVANC